MERSSERRVDWQELERAAQSLSAPAVLGQFTRIQRSVHDDLLAHALHIIFMWSSRAFEE